MKRLHTCVSGYFESRGYFLSTGGAVIEDRYRDYGQIMWNPYALDRLLTAAGRADAHVSLGVKICGTNSSRMDEQKIGGCCLSRLCCNLKGFLLKAGLWNMVSSRIQYIGYGTVWV